MKRTRTNTDRDQFKPDQYLIASDAIAFGMDPIYFEAPTCRFVSIWHRFELARIGIQPATPGFGSFRYHFKSKRYRFNSNRYRNDRKELPLKSINSRDSRFFDIVLTQSHITLTQSDIVLSHPEISWSRQPFAPGLDRKSTRLNSSHGYISYAVFCLKKKKKKRIKIKVI